MPERPVRRPVVPRQSRRARRRYQQALTYFLKSFWAWLPALLLWAVARDWGFIPIFLCMLGLGAGTILIGLAMAYAIGGWWAGLLFRHRLLAWHWRQMKLLSISVLCLAGMFVILAFLLAAFMRWEIPFGVERQTVSLGDNAFDSMVVGGVLFTLAMACGAGGYVNLCRFFGLTTR